MSGPGSGDAGLYLHIPFCSAICPYCDFAVRTGGDEARDEFVAALIREIELWGEDGWRFGTVYFGGGTPSILGPERLERICSHLRDTFALEPDTWLSLEANPEDVNPGSLRTWQQLGVRTLSLGVQSFDDAELRFLGRRHTGEEGRESIRQAQEAGFSTVSLDLIFGLPEQSLAGWRTQLTEAASLEADHISCYQLTLHEGTPFARQRDRGRLTEMPDDRQAELLEATHEVLGAHGLEAYEVSNFARSPEHRSRHNMKYWNHSPYLGLGPSAHSFRERRRWWNLRDSREWGGQLDRGQKPIADHEDLALADLALEAVMLGLRTVEGIDLEEFGRRFGFDLLELNRARVEGLQESGHARVEGGRLALTPRGLAIADGVAGSLEIV